MHHWLVILTDDPGQRDIWGRGEEGFSFIITKINPLRVNKISWGFFCSIPWNKNQTGLKKYEKSGLTNEDNTHSYEGNTSHVLLYVSRVCQRTQIINIKTPAKILHVSPSSNINRKTNKRLRAARVRCLF